MTIGEKIRTMRILRGKNQIEMAELLDINVKTYQGYETGKTDLPFSRIEQIAQVLKMKPFELVAFGESGLSITLQF